MRYMFLIYRGEKTWDFSPEAMVPWGKFNEEVQEADMATTVRVREDKILTTDGPFAETKEQLGGFYVLECQNLDEAIQIAARIPAAPHGSIEIRPLVELR